MNEHDLKIVLDMQMELRNSETEVCYERPDPVLVAQRYKEPCSALACGVTTLKRSSTSSFAC